MPFSKQGLFCICATLVLTAVFLIVIIVTVAHFQASRDIYGSHPIDHVVFYSKKNSSLKSGIRD